MKIFLFLLRLCCCLVLICGSSSSSSSNTTLCPVDVPLVGFGTAGLGGRTVSAVSYAITKGFRHIDTAQATEWYSEEACGQSIKEAKVSRAELFIVTKIHPRNFGYKTMSSFELSLQKLQTNYVDLLLLHTSDCQDWSGLCEIDPHRGNYLDAWKVLEEIYSSGKARAIGVSNFVVPQLEHLMREGTIPVHVVQNWMDPYHQDRSLREWCAVHGVIYTSYSTLGSQWQYRQDAEGRPPVLEHPIIIEIAQRHKTTPVLVVLTWALQEGVVIIPRSSQAPHINELSTLLKPAGQEGRFVLSEKEMEQINGLEDIERGGQKDGGTREDL